MLSTLEEVFDEAIEIIAEEPEKFISYNLLEGMIENDSIGHYEFWGAKCYDHQPDYFQGTVEVNIDTSALNLGSKNSSVSKLKKKMFVDYIRENIDDFFPDEIKEVMFSELDGSWIIGDDTLTYENFSYDPSKDAISFDANCTSQVSQDKSYYDID